MKSAAIATRELQRALERYLAVRPELGKQFNEAMKAAFADIAAYPDRYPVVLGTARQYLVDGFPYSVISRFRAGRITIVAVYHHSRKPYGWRRR
jgi:plasmid stabilization system protein ParE